MTPRLPYILAIIFVVLAACVASLIRQASDSLVMVAANTAEETIPVQYLTNKVRLPNGKTTTIATERHVGEPADAWQARHFATIEELGAEILE